MRIILALAVLFVVCTGASAQQPEQLHSATRRRLEVSVLQDPTLNRRVVVAPDGMISFPLVGHIRAAGMTTPVVGEVSYPDASGRTIKPIHKLL